MSAFDTATTLQRHGADRFSADLDSAWNAARGPWGGYVAALMLRALTETVDDHIRAPRSLMIHFPAVADPGAVAIETTIERQGRALSTLSARMTQGERVIALALAAFSEPWPADIAIDEVPAPMVPEPSEVESIPYVAKMMPEFSQHFDRRLCVGGWPFQGTEADPTVGGWTRPLDDRPLDALRLAAITDLWWPPAFARMTAFHPAPTVDLTIHFREPLNPDSPADSFVLTRFNTRLIADGFFESDGELWDQDGRLLAQSRQLGVIIQRESELKVIASRPA